MNVIVLAKQTPNMEAVRFDPVRGIVDRASAEAELNPFDRNAIQAATDLKARHGGCVTALCMGPPSAEGALREALALGADRAVLLSDARFGGADTLATARTLAAAIRKLGMPDVLFCGEKTVDGDTGQVGMEVATLLGIPGIPLAERIEFGADGSITAECRIWGSLYRRQAFPPCLISVTRDANTPAPPTLRMKLASAKAEITRWGADDIGIDPALVGAAGSPTRVAKVTVAPLARREGQTVGGDDPGAVPRFIAMAEAQSLL